MSKNEKKSLLQIQLENEAKAKEVIDKEQIKELNRALYQGQDLNKAAKSIFGPKENKEKGEMRLKSKNEMSFNGNWHE